MTPTKRRLVVLESPYRGSTDQEREDNISYAKKCMLDSLRRGESPIASHLLWAANKILDDENHHERMDGLASGHAWIGAAASVVVYTDRGVSEGMSIAIGIAGALGVLVEMRSLHDEIPKPDQSKNIICLERWAVEDAVKWLNKTDNTVLTPIGLINLLTKKLNPCECGERQKSLCPGYGEGAKNGLDACEAIPF